MHIYRGPSPQKLTIFCSLITLVILDQILTKYEKKNEVDYANLCHYESTMNWA